MLTGSILNLHVLERDVRRLLLCLNVSYFYPGAEAQDVFELPPEMANPQKTPCVNVPEWFVKEGGELCLSDTKNGLSIIRYWPKFLSERGNALMFKRLRKYCKWHQKQVISLVNLVISLVD